MVDVFKIEENPPYPNHRLPVLYYPKALEVLLKQDDPKNQVLSFFEGNGYSNGWVDGIFNYHHFHSNTHEVLACVSGSATVQLGGPGKEEYPFNKGDVVLLPAGVAHKLIESTRDFNVVGAYPNGKEPDLQRGEAEDYTRVQKRSYNVSVPYTDPVEKINGPVQHYWKS